MTLKSTKLKKFEKWVICMKLLEFEKKCSNFHGNWKFCYAGGYSFKAAHFKAIFILFIILIYLLHIYAAGKNQCPGKFVWDFLHPLTKVSSRDGGNLGMARALIWKMRILICLNRNFYWDQLFVKLKKFRICVIFMKLSVSLDLGIFWRSWKLWSVAASLEDTHF